MIFSTLSYIFIATIVVVSSAIYGSYCYIGFDAKSMFDEMVSKWQKAKADNSEPDVETAYFGGFMRSLLNLVFILIGVVASVILLKIVSSKSPPKINDIVDILVACVISVFLAVGLTMAAVRMLPILGRAFENTVGYMGISSFGDLDTIMDSIFTNSTDSKIKYGVLATKMFDNGFFGFLEKMKTAETSPIRGVFLKKEMMDFSGDLKMEAEDTNPLYQLFKLVAMKHTISEATWMSLATGVALFSGFVMIQYSGIRKKL
jgi:hypothetical protein